MESACSKGWGSANRMRPPSMDTGDLAVVRQFVADPLVSDLIIHDQVIGSLCVFLVCQRVPGHIALRVKLPWSSFQTTLKFRNSFV